MEKFDVIIVGAGLAGLGAAYTLAGQDFEVLVLERGDYPGAKNVTGGRIYLNPARDLFPDLWQEAPLERFIVHEGVTLMAKERSVAIDYAGDELRQEPHQSYSVLRARFDRWFAEQVEAKGAMILPKIRVENVIKENGKIVGVLAGGGVVGGVLAADRGLRVAGGGAGAGAVRVPGPDRAAEAGDGGDAGEVADAVGVVEGAEELAAGVDEAVRESGVRNT